MVDSSIFGSNGEVLVSSKNEVINRLKKRIEELETINKILQKYVPCEVMKKNLELRNDLLKADKFELSVLFVDLRGLQNHQLY